MIDTALQWLEESSWAAVIRKSAWLYPALEIVHIAGIVLLVGPALMFDMRLLGFSNKLPVRALSRHLLVWSRRSLLLVIPSGIFLFITNAGTLGYDPVFWLKMVLLIVAGLNALLFHRWIFHAESSTDEFVVPGRAKLTAMVSIIVWLATIACGRLLAY
jgi:hypothetical protein